MGTNTLLLVQDGINEVILPIDTMSVLNAQLTGDAHEVPDGISV
jgi:hypothetical protein